MFRIHGDIASGSARLPRWTGGLVVTRPPRHAMVIFGCTELLGRYSWLRERGPAALSLKQHVQQVMQKFDAALGEETDEDSRLRKVWDRMVKLLEAAERGTQNESVDASSLLEQQIRIVGTKYTAVRK